MQIWTIYIIKLETKTQENVVFYLNSGNGVVQDFKAVSTCVTTRKEPKIKITLVK